MGEEIVAEQRHRESEARELLRKSGVEIDASDHRAPTEIVSALAALGILTVAIEPAKKPSLTSIRAESPYLAFVSH